jgi:S-adenosylmethionine:tRNA ribosyltransferase-isomerase
LHVGAGTFKPVKTETAEEHDMHAEYIEVSRTLLDRLIATTTTRIAVGTTSLRTLESIYWMGVKLIQDPKLELHELAISQWEAYTLPQTHSFDDAIRALAAKMDESETRTFLSKTAIMIKPGYAIRSIDAILTNFHQPRSTLLLLIHAFVGDDWKRIYQYALEHDFRFLSYGDGSLLWLKK